MVRKKIKRKCIWERVRMFPSRYIPTCKEKPKDEWTSISHAAFKEMEKCPYCNREIKKDNPV